MKILFLGINHFDLLGAVKIRVCLEEQKQLGVSFDSVCIEWDEEVAITLINRRKDLRELIIQEYPENIKGTTIELIVSTLAYEADAFKQVYDIQNVYWLDKGRKPDSYDQYIKDRLFIYTLHSKSYSIDINEVERLSQHLWEISMSGEDIGTDSDRDEFLLEGIEAALKSGKQNVLVIVGAMHASLTRRGSTASLLLREGYFVESKDLASTPLSVDPTPTQPDV